MQAIAARIGARVTLSIGGKIAMPAIPAESPPLTVTGTVKTISNGRYRTSTHKATSLHGTIMDVCKRNVKGYQMPARRLAVRRALRAGV